MINSKIKLICENCGIEFLRYPANCINTHNFCSQKCYGEYYRNGKIIKCPQCGNPTYKTGCDFRRSKNLFCSIECRNKYRSLKIKTKCRVCGKGILVKRHRFKKSGNFCSRDCSLKFQRKNTRPSKIQNEIAKAISRILKDNNFEQEVTFDWLIGSRGCHLFVDIYFPQKQLAIEYNGPQHRSVFPYKGEGEKRMLTRFRRVQECDKEKKMMLRKHKVKLIEIDCKQFKNWDCISQEKLKKVLAG